MFGIRKALMSVIDFTAVRERKLGNELASLIWFLLSYRR